MRGSRSYRAWGALPALLALTATLARGHPLGLLPALPAVTGVGAALVENVATKAPTVAGQLLPAALSSANSTLAAVAGVVGGSGASNASSSKPVQAPVLPWVLPVPVAERTDASKLVGTAVDSLLASGAGPLAPLADVTGVADVATGGTVKKSLTDVLTKTLGIGQSAQLPSVLGPLSDVLTIGGSPLLTRPLPDKTFQVVGQGNDQNKDAPEDPYQDLSAHAKSEHPASGVAQSAVSTAETRAAMIAAQAVPPLPAAYGSNYLPGVNLFLQGALRVILGL